MEFTINVGDHLSKKEIKEICRKYIASEFFGDNLDRMLQKLEHTILKMDKPRKRHKRMFGFSFKPNEYRDYGDHLGIVVNYKGEEIISKIDKEDYRRVKMFRWHMEGKRYVGSRTIKADSAILLHSLITSFVGEMTDHINGDKLDNRKSNLRPCTKAQNDYNVRRKVISRTGFIGVISRSNGDIIAQIVNNGKREELGKFKDKIEAARTYDKRCLELRGEFAVLNFPRGEYQPTIKGN